MSAARSVGYYLSNPHSKFGCESMVVWLHGMWKQTGKHYALCEGSCDH